MSCVNRLAKGFLIAFGSLILIGVEAFLNAIQEQARRQQSGEDQGEEGQGEDQSGDRMDED